MEVIDCPVCGSRVNALVHHCPECGADPRLPRQAAAADLRAHGIAPPGEGAPGSAAAASPGPAAPDAAAAAAPGLAPPMHGPPPSPGLTAPTPLPGVSTPDG